jgi:hypothetical protein
MSGLYEYFFSQDSLVVKCGKLDIIIIPGMSVHVKSKRLQAWCTDGIIKSIYKSGVYVSYGHAHYFNFFTRGNQKFVSLTAIPEELRFPAPLCLKPVEKNDLEELH